METINERFQIIVDRWYAGNETKFAQSMGKATSSFNKIINGTVNPRAATLQEVCKVIPDLNPAWLLMGEGSITRTPTGSILAPESQRLYEDIIKSKDSEIKTKDEIIDIMRDYIAALKSGFSENKNDKN